MSDSRPESIQTEYKVGDYVRVVHTDWPEEYPVGTVRRVMALDDYSCGLYLALDENGLGEFYFFNQELEPATEADAIITPQRIPMQNETAEHVSPTGGRRANAGKLPVELVPASLILGVAAVLKAGAAKYAPRNWEKGMELSIPYACAVRHLLAWLGGQDNDPETGEPHMAHVATNAAFVLEYQRRIAAGTLPATLDDRPAP